MVPFKYEADFEKALIKVLSDKGWEHQVLKYPTEQNQIHERIDAFEPLMNDENTKNDCEDLKALFKMVFGENQKCAIFGSL